MFSWNVNISLFRGRASAVVDHWIVAHRSTPKKYQRVLNSEILPSPSAGYTFLNTPQKLAILHTLEHTARIHDVKFAKRVDGTGEVLLVAAEDKTTTVYEVHPDASILLRPTARLVGHGNRYDLDLHRRSPTQLRQRQGT